MCGIVGIVSNRPIAQELKEALTKVNYRGYDSYGVAISEFVEKLVVVKDVGYVENLKLEDWIGEVGIGHTRWATHGAVTKENAHPFTDCKGNVAIVHNGIISNYEAIKEILITQGHKFTSQTDSEVVAHLLEHYVHGFEMDFYNMTLKLTGSYAIVACHSGFNFLMATRHESPLLIGIGQNKVMVSSDISAFDESIERIIDCDEKSVYKVSLKEIKRWYMKGNTLSYEIVLGETLKNKAQIANRGDYEHYMLKEIDEQPEMLMRVIEQQDKEQLIGTSFDVWRASNVILTACGTSRYAAIIGRYLMSKLAKKFSEQVVASELQYFADSFNDSTTIIAVSQSGETADVISSVKIAKEKGAKIISLVNREYSTLERISDVTLKINCGAEIAVASTKAFTNELALFYLLAFTMANQYDNGVSELIKQPNNIKKCLAQKEHIKVVANKIKDVEHIYYIGKGINFAISGECALKLKEISYIHAESMSAGELKHGTLSLVTKGTPVIGLCPNDYTFAETISNLHEAKARGGIIIGISDKTDTVYDYWLKIPTVQDIYYPMLSTIIGQLLAYYVAVARGLNPDLPRSLAKSVTVR